MTEKGKPITVVLAGLDGKTRLDKALRAHFPTWGRAAVGQTINQRNVFVNGQKVWMASWKVKNGDTITINHPPRDKPQGPKAFDPRWLIADEGDLLVVNKPAGLLAQATRAGGTNNLLSLAQAKYGEVHLFHRLDRDTSGLCLLTRPGSANAMLAKAFQERLVEKEYLALISTSGQLKDEGEISTRLDTDPKRRDKMVVVERGGRGAHTRYKLEGKQGEYWLVRLLPTTGRTHQLRVHLAHLGAPVVGDRLYGGNHAPRLMLHAHRLALPAMEGFSESQWTVDVPEGFGKG